MSKHFPNSPKNVILQIQYIQKLPGRRNTNESMSKVKMPKNKDKLLKAVSNKKNLFLWFILE